MHIHFRRFLLLAAILWGFAAVGPAAPLGLLAQALAQPQPVNRLATKTSPLTQPEQAELEAFVQYWVGHLATGEPDAIRESVRALDEPLRSIGVTRIFRDEYSRAAIPRLEALLAGNVTTEVAVNAMKIASFFGTERALRLMADRSDAQNEKREAVRLWAARGFQMIVEGETIETRQLSSRVRELTRAAVNEENWLVLRRQFEALAVVPGSIPQQIEVLGAAAVRMAEDEKTPNPMMESLHRAMVLLRNQWINMADPRQRQTFGATAAPAVVRVLEVAEAHWEKAHEHERARGWYHAAVQVSETLLIAIDLQLRPNRANPEARLDAAWRQRDREAFKQHLRTWQEVTGRDPYEQPPRR